MNAKNGILQKRAESDIATEMCRKLRVKTPSYEKIVNQLSGGNQQKVIIAKWLMMYPKVLILDEPTRGIDVGAKSEIYQIMNELTEQGVSICLLYTSILKNTSVFHNDLFHVLYRICGRYRTYGQHDCARNPFGMFFLTLFSNSVILSL